MGALNQIRSRLKAVGNIKQITTSMEMVASARLRKAQERAKKAQFYVAALREILIRLAHASTDYKHPLFAKRTSRKTALVVVSSDRGLCGAYNTRVIAAAETVLRPGMELILVGQRAIRYFQQKSWLPIRREWKGWSGKTTYPQIQAFTTSLLHDFLQGDLDEVWLVYTKFHNLTHRVVTIHPFLPIGKPDTSHEPPPLNYIFEPDLTTLYAEILSRYCVTQIETMLDQAYAAELAARIFAMKAASQNAEEMLENLTLERNKVRQSSITRELLEMTSLAQ
jgi:F-type H+-transporting ATPase subunit gamma